MVRAKLIMQNLWLEQSDWDEPVNKNQLFEWDAFTKNLRSVEEIVVSRWTHYQEKKHGIELHGFCDASEKAYGAVIYSRIKTTTGKIYVTLLQAKSKVAPIKMKKSLPRLELCAALLLAKLFKQVIEASSLQNTKNYAWSDSMITLSWIKGRPDKWQNFVANRVAEIQSLTRYISWKHISGEDNPADVLSRGIQPELLETFTLWWKGPHWLNDTTEDWETQNVKVNETSLESKKITNVNVATAELTESIFNRYSTLRKLTTIMSYCLRFRKTKQYRGLILTAREREETLERIIKVIQHSRFKEEIERITQKQELRKVSSLISLRPQLDKQGVLRVWGRLDNSSMAFGEKHPIILPMMMM